MREKSKVKRAPKRAIYDIESIYEILDNQITCHIAFIHKGYPVSIPTTYGRHKNTIYIHGAGISRMLVELEKGVDICLSVAKVTAMILTRSAFHHSANYESAVVFGKGRLVEGDEKITGLKAITENFLKGRWDEVRPPSQKELNATKVIAIEIDEASAKVRNEGVSENKKDLELPIWAGIIPVEETYGVPIPEENMNKDITLSKSVLNINNK